MKTWRTIGCLAIGLMMVLSGCQCGGNTSLKEYECDDHSECKKNQACQEGKCVLDDNDDDGFPSRTDCNDQDPDIYPGRNEVCDNKVDDNCNGQIDETPCRCEDGTSKECGTDEGTCRKGTQQCTNGKWGECKGGLQPEREECNGTDDDCDGSIDEDFPLLGKQCERGEGECKASGKYACSKDRQSVDCEAQEGTPVDETCDGKDNDCDGKIDEIKECQKRFLTATSFTSIAQYNNSGKYVFFGTLGQSTQLTASTVNMTSTSGRTLRGGILSQTATLTAP